MRKLMFIIFFVGIAQISYSASTKRDKKSTDIIYTPKSGTAGWGIVNTVPTGSIVLQSTRSQQTLSGFQTNLLWAYSFNEGFSTYIEQKYGVLKNVYSNPTGSIVQNGFGDTKIGIKGLIWDHFLFYYDVNYNAPLLAKPDTTSTVTSSDTTTVSAPVSLRPSVNISTALGFTFEPVTLGWYGGVNAFVKQSVSTTVNGIGQPGLYESSGGYYYLFFVQLDFAFTVGASYKFQHINGFPMTNGFNNIVITTIPDSDISEIKSYILFKMNKFDIEVGVAKPTIKLPSGYESDYYEGEFSLRSGF